MIKPTDLAKLDPQQRGHLQPIVSAFQEAWRKVTAPENAPDLQAFAPPPQDPLRLWGLVELIKCDLTARWRRHEPAYVEWYLAQFPELAQGPWLMMLLLAEHEARNLFGDRPTPEAFQSRFPEQVRELRRVLEGQTLRPLPSQSATPPTAEPPSLGGLATVKPGTDHPVAPVQPRSDAAAAPADPKPPGSAARVEVLSSGKGYKLIKRLGSGSYGEVWRAEAPGGFDAAVKIIFRPLSHQDAQTELASLEVIRRLHHPFLVQTQAYESEENQLFIIMELADGSLRDRLRECRADGMMGIPVEELLKYFHQVGEAIDYLHSQNVFHRDIKPENIMLVGKFAKVGDFGLVRLLGDSRHMVTVSTSGTPVYMAPEVWTGHLSRNTDQYSLAISYVELRLGRFPFPEAANMLQLMTHHLEKDPELDPLDPAEQAVLRRALAKKPEDRYESCQAFAQALEEALFPPPEPPPPPEPEPLPRPSLGKRLVQWSALVVLAAIMGLGGFLLLQLLGIISIPSPVPAGSFTLTVPESLELVTGETKSLRIELNRRDFAQPVRLSFEGVPDGVKLEEKTAAEGEKVLEIPVHADWRASSKTTPVIVHADSGDQHPTAVLQLTIIFLPSDFVKLGEKAKPDANGRQYYSRIGWKPPGVNDRVEFILIPKSTNDSDPVPGSYYIMEYKVSVGLFKQFAKDQAGRAQEWNKSDSADFPVLGVGIEDANRFAKKWFPGKLPTAAEWDKAAGYYKKPRPGEGPFQGSWGAKSKPQIAADKDEAQPLDKKKFPDDVSKSGCRFMAGNGNEWTRTWNSSKAEIDFSNPGKKSLVALRGKPLGEGYGPLLFTDLDNNKAGGLLFGKTAADLGFRVVIEP